MMEIKRDVLANIEQQEFRGDRTNEPSLNVKLAEFLRRRGLDAVEEQRVKSADGTLHQIDILVDMDEYAVALEAEIAPDDGISDAEKRITDPPLQWGALPIQAVYAITYPTRLRNMSPKNAYDSLRTLDDLIFAHRFLGQQWSPKNSGSISDLADLLHDYWAKSDSGQSIEGVMGTVSFAIDQASKIFHKHDVGTGERDGDPAATKALIWLNALLFQELLAKQLNPNLLPAPYTGKRISRPDIEGGYSSLLNQWDEILDINWWPIFGVTRESFKQTPPELAMRAIRILADGAIKISESGLIRRHDVAGRIFHRLLDTRKFLATNYTTISAAILLSSLAFDNKHSLWDNRNFSNPNEIENLKIVDPACGSGTLLMAAAQEVIKKFRQSSSESIDELTKMLLENVLYGFDVVPAAIHLAASTLSMSETSQLITEMKLWRMHHGVYKGVPRLGSLDMLETSQTLGNAQRLPLLSSDDGAQVTGEGESPESAIQFPEEVDLIIANPPYTRTGGPGDQENKSWNPIFGSLINDEDQKKMNSALNKALSGTPASALAGLGSAFVVLAHQHLKIGGRLAMVLPSVFVTGSSWKGIRKLLVNNYFIDWVVASHDPRIRGAREGIPGRMYSSFSESTNMSEVLIVATRASIVGEASSHSVKFVNIRFNPTDVMEAHALVRTILNLAEEEKDIPMGNQSWGEVSYVPQKSLSGSPWRATSFVQERLLTVASELDAQTYGSRKIPVSKLSSDWQLGPYHMNIKGRYGLFDCVNGYDPMRLGSPALWHHDANNITRMATSANAQLIPRVGIESQRHEQMLERAAKLQLCCELRTNTQKLAAVVTNSEMIGVRSFITLKPISPNMELGSNEMLCLWLNSSPGFLLRYVHANRPYPRRSSLTHTSASCMPVLNVSELSKTQLKSGMQAYQHLKGKELMPIFKMDRCKTRLDIDNAVCSILDLPKDAFQEIRKMMVIEPSISGNVAL